MIRKTLATMARLGFAALALIIPTIASAYPDCWTGYFKPAQYINTWDQYGLRYIAGLPAGVTCGCTSGTDQIWASSQGPGVTAGTLAAVSANLDVRFLLQSSDTYCRATIVEIKPH